MEKSENENDENGKSRAGKQIKVEKLKENKKRFVRLICATEINHKKMS